MYLHPDLQQHSVLHVCGYALDSDCVKNEHDADEVRHEFGLANSSNLPVSPPELPANAKTPCVLSEAESCSAHGHTTAHALCGALNSPRKA